jgi:hypothetical protein
MHNQAQLSSERSRSSAPELTRVLGQPVVVMATIGAEHVDANGAPCEPRDGEDRSGVVRVRA